MGLAPKSEGFVPGKKVLFTKLPLELVLIIISPAPAIPVGYKTVAIPVSSKVREV